MCFLTLHGLCVLYSPLVTSVVSLYSKGMKELLWEILSTLSSSLNAEPLHTLLASYRERLIWSKMHKIFCRLKKYCDI